MTLILALILAAQDKEPSFSEVLSKTGAQKSYDLKMSGGAESITGTYENGGLILSAKSAQVAGRGGLTIGNVGGGWVPLEQLLPSQPKNAALQNLSKIQPPHAIILGLAGSLGPVTGRASSGFSADLQPGAIRELAKAPWVGHKSLQNAMDLKGSVKFTTSGGLITKAEIHFTGNEAQKTFARGKMPTPPQNNGQVPATKPVNVTVTIELSDFGSARLPEDLKGKIGSN
jgi:hypothetical protein